ncbi:MAG: hypothetical protein H3C52_09045 [Anaerolineales bacterium]|nr:hypothetical protein [Anaerolineales bacterium]MCZ2289708.1 hypothetical protein [Anaerolineales bacterium]
MPRFFLPRLRDILFIAIFLGALLLGPRMLSLDSDLGRHLALGGYILKTRSIPTVDILSFTRNGEPRPPYEWLTQVLFALANSLLGLDGTILLCAGIIAAGFAVLYNDAARRSRMPLAAAAIVALAAAASSLHWLPRPHVTTFLFLALWLERLDRIQRGERVALWQFPGLMLVWANAHGGFIFGMLAWLAYTAGWGWEKLSGRSNWQAGKRWIAIGALALSASFITPSGWGNWLAVLNNDSRYILNRTVETMPADFSNAGTRPFVLLLGLSVFTILATRKAQSASHVFLLGGFALLGLLMARNIPLFAIASAPILAEGLGALLGRVPRWKRIESNIAALESLLRGALWPILVGAGIAVFLGIRYQVQKESLTHFEARVFPVAAADWLAENPQPGKMFNEFNWGGYLLYRLWPGQKVFLDSQTDFYGEALTREYETAWTASGGWEDILARYEIAWVVLPREAPLARRLSQSAEWTTLYSDPTTVILRMR